MHGEPCDADGLPQGERHGQTAAPDRRDVAG